MTTKALDKPPGKPAQKHSRADLEAGDRLLRAIRAKVLKEAGRLDGADLRSRGYSEGLIARLREI